jgi:hypothetical protein
MKFDDLKRTNENEILGRGVSSVVLEMFHQESKKCFAVKVCIFLLFSSLCKIEFSLESFKKFLRA